MSGQTELPECGLHSRHILGDLGGPAGRQLRKQHGGQGAPLAGDRRVHQLSARFVVSGVRFDGRRS